MVLPDLPALKDCERRVLKNITFALMKSFPTPRRLAVDAKAKRSLSFAFLRPLHPCCDGVAPRKSFKIALQAAFFSSCDFARSMKKER
jgi:hypothetical protein